MPIIISQDVSAWDDIQQFNYTHNNGYSITLYNDVSLAWLVFLVCYYGQCSDNTVGEWRCRPNKYRYHRRLCSTNCSHVKVVLVEMHAVRAVRYSLRHRRFTIGYITIIKEIFSKFTTSRNSPLRLITAVYNKWV